MCPVRTDTPGPLSLQIGSCFISLLGSNHDTVRRFSESRCRNGDKRQRGARAGCAVETLGLKCQFCHGWCKPCKSPLNLPAPQVPGL